MTVKPVTTTVFPVSQGSDINPAIAELAQLDRWVCWRAENRDGKFTKVPRSPRGRNASSTDPSTWATFEDCHRAAFARNTADGIGIVLDGSDDLVGFDLDDCLEGGTLAPWAQEIADRLSSYTEVTPSGSGVRIFCRGTIPVDGRKKGDIECYRAKRFLTITGKHLAPFPDTIKRRGETIRTVFKELFGEVPKHTNGATEWPDDLPEPMSEKLFMREMDMFPELCEPNYKSPSDRDWALARHAKARGWSEEKAAAFIRAARQTDDESDRAKGDRGDYIRGTVANAYADTEPDDTPIDYAKIAKIVPLTVVQFIKKERPPLESYVDGLLSTSSALIVQGKKSAGKSRFTEAMVHHIEIGADFLGFQVKRRGRILYLDGEMAPQRIAQRLEQLVSSHHRYKRKLPGEGAFFILSWQELRREGVNLGKLTSEKTRAILDGIIEENRIDIIVVDHFSKLVGGSNDADTLRAWKVVEDWITDHRGVGRSFVVLMHEGHTEGRIRGFTEIYDSFDNAVRVSPMKKQNDGFYRFKIEGQWERDGAEEADTRPRIVQVPEDDLSDWGRITYANDHEKEEDDKPTKRHKLTPRQRENIEHLLREGKTTQAEIARMHDVSESWISQIAREVREEAL